MFTLRTRVDTKSETFQNNLDANVKSIDELQANFAKAKAGGGEKYVKRHLDRGKLLPRQRVELLLDRGSPFLELCALAGIHEKGTVPGAGVIGGVGRISGVECLITASEATVQGGAISVHGLAKSKRLAQVALENHLPTVHCIESAGADLTKQADIFVPGGAGFRDITRRSEQRLPTISLVFGSCTAGGAYIPGMSDYTVMVKDAAYMYLAGPPLVKMATGEVVDDETLGGATMHSRVSGVSDYLAENELDCIRIGRELVSTLGWEKPWARDLRHAEPPKYDPHELLGIASADIKEPFDIREVLARVIDGSRFHEFKPTYGSTLVCGFARIGGYRVGILGNNGVLFSESANKGAQFIQLCNQTDTPLIFFQNITGSMVGQSVEETGIIKNGAKLINAVSNSTVPAITIMVGASYGAGNYAMCGRAYEPRFVFAWPNHKIAVMGSEQAAGVLEIIRRASAAKRGLEIDEEQLGMQKQFAKMLIDQDSTCWSSTGRLWDDGIIDPRDTRIVLIQALSIAHNTPVEGTTSWGTFRH